MTILPLTYLGNTEYFSHLLAGGCVVDIGENYVKQTHRNRCEIAAANGRAALTVNVVKGGSMTKKAVKDIRIDYSKRWQHQHALTLISAYKNAPYFEHYWERLESFYVRRYDFLADFNLALLEVLTGFFRETMPQVSEIYVAASPGDTDLRGAFPPKEGAGTPTAGRMGSGETGARNTGWHQVPDRSATKHEKTGSAVNNPATAENTPTVHEKSPVAKCKEAGNAINDPVKAENTGATHEKSLAAKHGEAGSAAYNPATAENTPGAHEKNPACAEPVILIDKSGTLPYSPVYYQKPYWQVFSDRHPFIPGLSIIDLVFCEGPRARGFLSAAAGAE